MLGGDEGVTIFVTKLLSKVSEDPQLSQFFENSETSLLKEKLRQFFTYITGGSKNWIGKDMAKVHQKLHINNEMFDKFNEHAL